MVGGVQRSPYDLTPFQATQVGVPQNVPKNSFAFGAHIVYEPNIYYITTMGLDVYNHNIKSKTMRKFCARASMLWHWSASGWQSGLDSLHLQPPLTMPYPVITLFPLPPSDIPTGPLVCTVVCECSSPIVYVCMYVGCFITFLGSFSWRVNNLCHIPRFYLVSTPNPAPSTTLLPVAPSQLRILKCTTGA